MIRLLSLLLLVLVVPCLSCNRPAVQMPDEDEAEDNTPVEKAPPESMVHAHKVEPEYHGKPLRYWLAESKSESAASRRAAAEALGNMGPAGLPALREMLRDQDMGVKLAAATAMKRINAGQRSDSQP